jgi:hypothetical protein
LSFFRRKKEEGRGKKEEGRRKREEGRGKKEEGRRKREEGRGKKLFVSCYQWPMPDAQCFSAQCPMPDAQLPITN